MIRSISGTAITAGSGPPGSDLFGLYRVLEDANFGDLDLDVQHVAWPRGLRPDQLAHAAANDAVRGFITRGRGVSVHRADCGSLARLARRDPDRVIEVSWGSAASQAYEVDVELRGYDRKGLQKDVTSVISNAQTHIIASSSRLRAASGEVEMRFTLRVRDFEQLSTLLGKLLALPNVVHVRRVGVG